MKVEGNNDLWKQMIHKIALKVFSFPLKVVLGLRTWPPLVAADLAFDFRK